MENARRISIIAVAAIIALAALGCKTAPVVEKKTEGPAVQGALYLLAKSRSETCSTCRAEMEKDAFAELSKDLVPGRRFSGTFLVKEDELGKRLVFGQLPSWVSFCFHVRGRRWVGIKNDDLSAPSMARKILSSPGGTGFSGSVVLVPYPYGDGPSYSWARKKGILEIHCKIIDMDRQ